MVAAAARFAMNPGFKAALGNVLKRGFLPQGDKVSATRQLIDRLGLDVVFGGLTALQTPGDLGDKLIAGGATALGGGLGGGIVTGATGGRLGQFGELAGSIGGDMIALPVGDTLLRAKDKLTGGEGLTPYEKMSAQQQTELANQVRAETLMAAGLLPGVQQQYMGLYS